VFRRLRSQLFSRNHRAKEKHDEVALGGVADFDRHRVGTGLYLRGRAALSEEKQAYYIKVLNITLAQQQRIRRECYGPKASTGHFGHRQWDASVER
jgi:hypothetical protein